MDIYEMFYLCASTYFKTQKDLILREATYIPGSDGIILHLSLESKGEIIIAVIEFDENGSPIWKIEIEDMVY